MPRAQGGEDVPSSDDEAESTADSDTDSLCDDETDAESDTDLESLLERLDSNADDDDDEDDLFEDEVRHPPEHYLAAAAILDVQLLRQKRYGPNTQNRFDWVKKHHDWYEKYLNQRH